MNDQKLNVSNFGRQTVCIFAPGENLRTTARISSVAYVGRTSNAVPHVVGVAALMLSINPNLTPMQIRELIIDSADSVAPVTNYCQYITYHSVSGLRGGGRLNAYRAVRATQALSMLQTRTHFGVLGSTVEIIGMNPGFKGHLVIPSRINNNPVTRIRGNNPTGDIFNPPGLGAFEGHTGLTGVSVSNSVDYIGARAFGGANNLQRMTLPFVGNQPAVDTGGLIAITPTAFGSIFTSPPLFHLPPLPSPNPSVPLSLRYVTLTGGSWLGGEFAGGSAFAGLSQLHRVVIPQSTNTISANAFANCHNLTITVIGRTARPVGWNANWNPGNRPVVWRL